eukprot:scaffold3316_cov94-Skeletonema_marinoi.AAC.23
MQQRYSGSRSSLNGRSLIPVAKCDSTELNNKAKKCYDFISTTATDKRRVVRLTLSTACIESRPDLSVRQILRRKTRGSGRRSETCANFGGLHHSPLILTLPNNENSILSWSSSAAVIIADSVQLSSNDHRRR